MPTKNQKQLSISRDIASDLIETISNAIIAERHSETPSDITIYFNSEGGDCKGVIGLCNLIDSTRNILITGIAIGKVESAAFDLFCACRRREAHVNASFFTHDIIMSGINNMTFQQCIELGKTKEAEQRRLMKYIYRNTDLTEELIARSANHHNKNDRGYGFDAETALNLGVVHKTFY